jgi:NitT/TauT family transport system substrate-binding protein
MRPAKLGTLVLACLLAIGLGLAPAGAQAPLKKVRIAVGTTVLNVTYPWLNMPIALGYWREEGYDVDVQPVGASLQALQQMVAGNAEFAEINSSVVAQANVVNDLPVRIAMDNGVIDWSVGVLDGSPIQSIKELKGKTIGVFSLATGGIAFLKSLMRQNGMDPEHDVQLVATGLGAPAVDALRTGKVQALLYWAAAMAGFENAGLKMRYFRGEDWRSYPDLTMSVMQKTADADPKMVIAIARGAAKATVFALANPDCVRRIQWARWPNTKPSGAEEETLIRWDLNGLNAQLDTLGDAFKMNGGKYWGAADPAGYDRLQDFMVQYQQIPRKVPATNFELKIPDYLKQVNDFDAAAVQEAAKACRMP